MQTTKKLLNNYIELRDEIIANGPDSRLRVVRSLLNVTMKLFRVEQRYQKAKTKYPVYIEFLESDKPLTERDAKNLKDASTVNREITTILREWRHGGARQVQQ